MIENNDVVLNMVGITKCFDDLVANDNISFSLKKGEVLGILGENGAGKTTLMNVLYGLWQPDSGEIYVYGNKTHFKNPKDALDAKIGMVSQHYSLVPTTTVSENITLSELPRKKFTPFFDKKMAQKKSLDLAKSLDFHIELDTRVENLSVGEQQRVEILKALYQGAEILILDEPTAVLTSQEADELFNIIYKMTKDGKSIIFITHKLREAMKCDRIIVLRGGKLIFKKLIKETSKEELRNAMFGESEISPVCKTGSSKQQVIFEAKELSAKDYRGIDILKNISFKIHEGEIFGIAGIAGNGQAELAEVIAGVHRSHRGNIYLKSEDITRCSTKGRRERKIVHIPEERYRNGIFIDLPIYLNLILGREDKQPFCKNSLLKYNYIFDFSKEVISDYDVKTSGINMLVRHMSGGNMQKLLVAREFAANPDLIIASQPTRGLDIKTTDFVRNKLLEAREMGKAILLFSYDLDEIFLLSDRIGVMFEGEMAVIDVDNCERKTIELMMVSREVKQHD